MRFLLQLLVLTARVSTIDFCSAARNMRWTRGVTGARAIWCESAHLQPAGLAGLGVAGLAGLTGLGWLAWLAWLGWAG